MRVSHQDDHLSSIGVGAKKTTAFSIAQTPEFFMVLSKSLYSNERLAVVREVLCNGWDAHIASDCTDIPLEVTITDESITFRDFGPGISKDQIGQNYCTYGGGSTKTHDGRQTGGFSLGSKAPFAYADSFEVVSYHKGTKTIYNMVKSSPDNDGLPAADEILSVPTSETGLSVSINFKSDNDRKVFEEYVRTVARNGEMNVKLNGQVCQTIPFSKCKQGFLLLPNIHLNNGLWVRYGNVLYPVPDDDHYSSLYDELARLLRNASYNGGLWGNNAVVLLAPPNSISVTPSRESLSMSDTTKDTIQLLLTNLVKRLNLAIEEVKQSTVQQYLDLCWHPGNFHRISQGNFYWISALRRGKTDYDQKAINSAEKFAQDFIYFQARNAATNTARDIRGMTLKALAGSSNVCSPMVRKYLNQRNDSNRQAWWFGETVVKRLQKRLATHADLDPTRLYICERGPYGEHKIVRVSNETVHDHDETLRLIRGHVIITHTKVRVLEGAGMFPAMKHHFGSVNDSLVYIVPRRPGEVEKAKAFFTKMGFYPVDITGLAPGEKPQTKERAAPNYRPKREGYPKLSALRVENGLIDYNNLSSTELQTSDNPAAVIRITPAVRQNTTGIPGFSGTVSAFIGRMFGDQIVVVETPAHLEKAKQAGALDLLDFLEKEITNKLQKNSPLYRCFQIESALLNQTRQYKTQKEYLLEGISTRSDLRTMFGLEPNLDGDDATFRKMISEVALMRNKGPLPYIQSLVKLEPHKKAKALVKAVAESTRVNVIGWFDFAFSATDESTQKAQQDIIKFALKG